MSAPFSQQILAQYLVRALTRDHILGQRSDLDSLTRELGVRRADVRSTLSALHREGYVDVLRMRLTMEGFILGMILGKRELPPLRRFFPENVAAA